jgi:transketolase
MEALAGSEHPPRIYHLAVRDVPGSGRTSDLLAAEGIDADAIAQAARHAATTTSKSAGGQ